MNIENRSFRTDTKTLAEEILHQRRRSDGVLSQQQIRLLMAHGVDLAYDPAQIGWVPLYCDDDIAPERGVSSGLEFREWSRRDAPILARMLSSEALWRYLPEEYPGPIDAEAAESLIELGGELHHVVYAVTRAGIAIGQVRLHFNGPTSAELSYWLGEDHWGKGYASEMVSAFCKRSFTEHPNIERIFARVHIKNIASKRVLLKASLNPVAEEGDWITLERLRYSS